MSRIKLLPDSVANQIAAGEVVNRPASVVKELMENSADAGAKIITVHFRDGGRELIQIKDDGCGMSPQDARMAFERHATSKIAAVDDIYSLMTFGFRGEALASISAVSSLEMHTREEGAELGTRIDIDGGTFAGQSAVAAPRGTQIWIRNLFYNVPARKKFLDKASSEASHIVTEFQRVALAHPGIEFHLWRDDAPVYNLPAGNLHQRVVGIAGKGAAPKLLEVGVNTSLVRVSGFAGRPQTARQRCREQFFFVNGRFFKSPFFHKAVIQAYEKLIPATVQPPYFIYLEIDPEQIDVNVHPQKTEVKFTSGPAVWQIINAAVRETLAKSGAVPMMDFDSEDRLEIPVLGGYRGDAEGFEALREPAQVRDRGYNPFEYELRSGPSGYTPFGGGEKTTPSGLAGHASLEEGEFTSHFEYISSEETEEVRQGSFAALEEPRAFSGAVNIGEGYAAALYGGVFVAIDLRRAREAVIFERLRRMVGSGLSATQKLLFPERMALSVDDASLLKENTGEFTALGFDIREAGSHAVEIHGTPADMLPEALDEVVYGMLDELRDGVFAGADQRRERLAAVMARSGAGTQASAARISPGEMANLLDALAASANPSFTPRGKAVMAPISIEELRDKLK